MAILRVITLWVYAQIRPVSPQLCAAQIPNPRQCSETVYTSCTVCDLNDPVIKAFRRRQYFQEALASQIASGAGSVWGDLQFSSISSDPFQSWLQSTTEPWPMMIESYIEVLRISEINQKSQQFKVHMILTMTWYDCRTMHNCSQFKVSDDQPEYRKFWKPQYRLSELDHLDSKSKVRSSLVSNPDGWTSTIQERTDTFTCKFAFADMPFDEHTCGFKLQVPGIQSSLFKWERPKLQGSRLASTEWEIDQVQDWSVTFSEVAGLTGVFKVHQMKIGFHIKRKPGHLILSFVVPTLWIYMVSWVGLWIDPAAVPARAAMGVIPVLILINKQSALSASLPPISDATRLSVFMHISLAFVGLHMFEFGLVEFALRLRKQEASSDSGLRTSNSFRALQAGHNYGDCVLRIISIVAYAVCCSLVFFA